MQRKFWQRKLKEKGIVLIKEMRTKIVDL